jgi:phage/plasmid-like protein (TIGR03299 family)
MAHELVSGAYARTAPWHFAETGKDGRAVIADDLMTTEQALNLSGIRSLPTRLAIPHVQNFEGEWVPCDDWRAVVRNDTHVTLGMHTEQYEHIGFEDSFIAIGFAPDAKVWETMVLLRGGKVAAGVIRLPDLDRILPDGTQLAVFVAAYTSHDASFALTYKDTNVRIECMNLLRCADYEMTGRRIVVAHRSGSQERMQEAGRVITYAQERADYQERLCTELLAKQLSDFRARATVAELLPFSECETTQGQRASNTRIENQRSGILAIYNTAPDLANVKGTAWGLVQAVGAYSDHQATYRATKDATQDERRFIRTVIQNDSLADKALALVQATPL